MKRLGLDHETLRAANPRLVYASISGFGQGGPFSDLPAFDLVIQAMSGLMSLTGPRDGSPTAVGESIADICTGMFASWGVLAALFERERTGEGRHLEVAMLDSIFAMLLTGLSRRLFLGETPQRVGNRHPETYPVDSLPTRDGAIVIVAFSDAIFAAVARTVERPDLAQDARFVDNHARNANEDALRVILASWTETKTTEEALARFRAADVPCAPVWSLDDLLRSGHIAARGMLVKGCNSALGDIPLVPQPVMFGDAPRPAGQVAPCLGEHTEAVLGELLGLTSEQIRILRERRVV
jgi:CoA:oxalate CoA-transferase